MGRKGPDRNSAFRPQPSRAFTVGEMYALGWVIRTRCKMCGRIEPVNLVVGIRHPGARVTLWDRTQPCPVSTCVGQVVCEASTEERAAFWTLTWGGGGPTG
ncbi:MAG: hypothetical protein ACYDD1_09515 [Caulobacteraceae bacterium]